MKAISAEIIDKAWEKMKRCSDKEVLKLTKKLMKQQPAVLAYLMFTEGDLFNQAERGLLLFWGFTIWQIMLQGDKPLPEVTPDDIDSAEEANLNFLESLKDASMAKFIKATDKFLLNYNQRELLGAVVRTLIEAGEDEEDNIREENKGVMLFCIKTVIDCFDK